MVSTLEYFVFATMEGLVESANDIVNLERLPPLNEGYKDDTFFLSDKLFKGLDGDESF